MKFTILQENLARALSIVSRAVAPRSTLPVLANILLTTDNGRLRLSATNLEQGITCWVSAQVEEEGSITIPAKTLCDLVNTLNDRINATLDPKTATLKLVSGNSKTNIKGIDAAEFPPMPKPDLAGGLAIKGTDLKEAIKQVAFAASSDESRPILTGIHLTGSENALTFEAADGFRLSQRTLTLDQPVQAAFNIIVPAKAMLELASILGTDHVLVTISAGTIIFHTEEVELASQIIEGTYPDLTPIIPKVCHTRVALSVQALQVATRQAEIFAREASYIAKLHATPANGTAAKLEMSGQSPETGQMQTALEVSIEGQEQELALNVRYLAQVLSVMKTPNVALEITAPTSPITLRPVGEDNFLHIIMPMHLDDVKPVTEAANES